VLDVGVCHGTPELMRAFPEPKHLLFEPVREFEATIRRHYRNMDSDLHLVAVGDTEGIVSLKVSAVLPGMSISHSRVVEGNESDTSAHRTVPRVTLDGFLQGRELVEPYLLKVDIDGDELRVLQGAKETLKKCSIVIVECQSAQLCQRISAVQSAGFTLFDLAEPCYYDKVFWQCDAVFVRTDILKGIFKPLQGKVEPGMYESFR